MPIHWTRSTARFGLGAILVPLVLLAWACGPAPSAKTSAKAQPVQHGVTLELVGWQGDAAARLQAFAQSLGRMGKAFDKGRPPVAVFDWDMATRGDPLVDLGTLLAYWAAPDDPTFLIFGELAVSPAADLEKAAVTELYAATTGFDVSHIDYYEGLALYRIAVIIEQIYARYVAGQTSDQRFARFEPLAPLLAQAALTKLEKK